MHVNHECRPRPLRDKRPLTGTWQTFAVRERKREREKEKKREKREREREKG